MGYDSIVPEAPGRVGVMPHAGSCFAAKGMARTIPVFAPKVLHNKAQGREAHPGEASATTQFYANGVASNGSSGMMQPRWGRGHITHRFPGCASRPWALRCSTFGAKQPAIRNKPWFPNSGDLRSVEASFSTARQDSARMSRQRENRVRHVRSRPRDGVHAPILRALNGDTGTCRTASRNGQLQRAASLRTQRGANDVAASDSDRWRFATGNQFFRNENSRIRHWK